MHDSKAEGEDRTAQIQEVAEGSVYLYSVCKQQTDVFVHLLACALSM